MPEHTRFSVLYLECAFSLHSARIVARALWLLLCRSSPCVSCPWGSLRHASCYTSVVSHNMHLVKEVLWPPSIPRNTESASAFRRDGNNARHQSTGVQQHAQQLFPELLRAATMKHDDLVLTLSDSSAESHLRVHHTFLAAQGFVRTLRGYITCCICQHFCLPPR